MCFPLLAPLLTFASTAVSAAGSAMGGMMANSQAKAQAAAQNRQATLEAMQGDYAAQRKQEQVNQVTGAQIAGTAASGVTLEGSPSDVIASTASQGALDVGAIKWGAKVRADTFNYEAQLSRIQGRNAMAGGIMSGIGGLVGGLGKLGSSPSPTAQNPNATYFGNMFGTA